MSSPTILQVAGRRVRPGCTGIAESILRYLLVLILRLQSNSTHRFMVCLTQLHATRLGLIRVGGAK